MLASLNGGTNQLLIFSNSQISNNSWFEPFDVTWFPFSRRSIWKLKPTSPLFCHQGTPSVRSIIISQSEPSDETWFPFCVVRFEDLNSPAYSAKRCGGETHTNYVFHLGIFRGRPVLPNPLPKPCPCVSPPPRLALGVGTFQARCGSFQDLVSISYYRCNRFIETFQELVNCHLGGCRIGLTETVNGSKCPITNI
jgi:hypothetical protein